LIAERIELVAGCTYGIGADAHDGGVKFVEQSLGLIDRERSVREQCRHAIDQSRNSGGLGAVDPEDWSRT